MSTKWSFLLLLAVVLALTGRTQSFKPLFASENSISHRSITIRAVLRKTAEVCQDIAAAEGRDFGLTIDDGLTIERVHQECSSSSDISSSRLSSFLFHAFIADMYLSNAHVDLNFPLSAEHHFDDEGFQGGRDIITLGVSAVKSNVKMENFIIGRLNLGALLHTLQDFYSHSNWVELGNTAPYNVLITPNQPLENLAGTDIPTCRNCDEEICDDNILPNVLEDRLLTSGYFNLFFSEKPDGKCSHGGTADRTSRKDPMGGINKDDIESSHGSLHNQAANLAVTATMELLEDIRLAGGDKNFLRLMGLSQSSVLCYVIDTTGSMADDIEEAKRVAFEIIDRRRGTTREPPGYILVPFNDPAVGPVLVTTDADTFKERINELTAFGGGDNPEMSLSGLQLALITAPPSSEIFVFTDAPAKDAHLKSTITALIESMKSVVTFLLTDVLSSRRKRRRQGEMSRVRRVVSQADAQLYRDLARASGGQTIEVSKLDLALATSVIEDSSDSATVTIFQEVSSEPENFLFTIDSSLRNIIISITGNSALTFNLTSSTGVSQNSSESSGPLASLSLAGNLRRLRLNNNSETGLWEISIDSDDPYSVKVTGQSPLNFIYNLVEAHEGLHADFFLKQGRPLSGGNATILVTVTGTDIVNLTEVTLYDNSGPTDVNGTLQSSGATDFLVTFNEIPAGDFVVRLKGGDSNSSSRSTSSRFQRQASTRIMTSNISVVAQVNTTNIEPGSTIFIPFTVTITTGGVTNENATGTFTVRATNDRSFNFSSPGSVTIEADSGGKANDTVSLTVPESAPSGTDVTLTIEAENAAATEINFVVLRFSVAAKVTDVTGPVCQVVRTFGNCSFNSARCDSSQWVFVVEVTDRVDGTGIDSITVREGNGTLNTSIMVGEGGEEITEAFYQASCCADRVELSVVDNVGNVAICVGQVTDVLPPVCQEVSRATNCPSSSSLCDSFQWEFVVNVTDDINGVGIDNITIHEGNGTLNTTTVVGPSGENTIVASFRASCCANRVELSAVDKAGNEVICVGQARESTTVAPVTTANVTNEETNTGGQMFSTSHCLWITVVSFPLWR
ncbi:von Willebrand factor A domain-containing protein 7-like [Phyllopteryx taeniolatus]|uniref:von Willebrand factor A domain-containing protein 7-like n=1 Tax=Phyllopteryx taeniolatus TaxID=161469 RepID=UPI002AD32BC9|nr:von Willebrand factor A domain-containing protein 7-like [Phyllopteryx taeniolatus]